MLPEDLKVQAEKAARKTRVSLGQFIRASIEKAVRHIAKSGQEDPFFSDKTVWRGAAPRDGDLRKTRVSLGQFIRASIEKAVRHIAKSGQEDPFFSDKTVWRGAAPRDGAL